MAHKRSPLASEHSNMGFERSRLAHNSSPGDSISVAPERPPFSSRQENVSSSPIPSASVCRCFPSAKTRNLVVCIDGTANQFSVKNTNVVELYSRLIKDEDQLTYYNSGIGTYVGAGRSWKGLKQSVGHAVDLAIATSFKEKVLSAYQWLSENYSQGDKIYLFGFSRGAYQVRVIAGMIERVGLLHKGNNEQIPFAYELYTAATSGETRGDFAASDDSGADGRRGRRAKILRFMHMLYTGTSASIQGLRDPKETGEICKRFKRTLSRTGVRVHFVGAWDTVSSIGVLRRPSLPETTTGMSHVCVFRHALALDELRVKFLPEYVNGGAGPGQGEEGNVKEVWFAGSHSDIGGGNIQNLDLDQFGPSLRWMSYEAIVYGLKMASNRGQWYKIPRTPSMNWKWWPLEYIIPLPHLSYKHKDSVTWSLHCRNPRQIMQGQSVHASAFDETEKDYTPSNTWYDPSITWNKDTLQQKNLIEKDPYANADGILSKLVNYSKDTPLKDQDIDILRTLANGEIGRRSITEFPHSANLLINAIEVELQTEESKNVSSTFYVFVYALTAFPSLPILLHFTTHNLWDTLDNTHTKDRDRWANFRTMRNIGNMQRRKPGSIFAIVIGTFNKACVADADDMDNLLRTHFNGKPTNLRNEEATPERITSCIQSISGNPDFRRDDPILIYYAGLGARTVTNGHTTTCIAPLATETQLNLSDVITATKLNHLLAELAHEKGNNITVILDCSNASDFIQKTYDHDPASYVLLEACQRNGQSRSVAGRGVFTSALTTLLRESDINRTTYKDVINFFDIGDQSPRCSGKHSNRILFTTETPSNRCVRHKIDKKSRLVLEVGEAQGITMGADFSFLHDIGRKPAIPLKVHKVDTYSTILEGGPLHTGQMYIRQTYAGPSADLRISGDTRVIRQAYQPDELEFSIPNSLHRIRLLDDESPHSIANLNGKTVDFTMTADLQGVNEQRYRSAYDAFIPSVLPHAAHFSWHLRRISSDPELISEGIAIEAFNLNSPDVLLSTSGNLVRQDKILLEIDSNSKTRVGFIIKSRCEFPIFVWLFSFSTLDLAIYNIYKPAYDPRNGSPCLGDTGQFKAGHISMEQLNLPPDLDTGVIYIKAFITTQYVDLDFLEQDPLVDLHPISKGETEASTGTPHLQVHMHANPFRHRGGSLFQRRSSATQWYAKVIPIVVTRKLQQ